MHRTYLLLKCLAVLAVVSFVVAMVFPSHNHSRFNARRASCQSNLKSIALAVQYYSGQYDDTFPLAQAGAPGWTDVLLPFMSTTPHPEAQNRRQFDCPEGGPLPASTATVTDYFYNLRLSREPSSSLIRPDFTILLSEGEPASANYACWDFSRCIGQTATGPVGAVPEAARTRHLDGENIAFTDGHVKWFARERQQPKPHPAEGLSFALK